MSSYAGNISTGVKLSDFKLLVFDVYGTLVDWEIGIIESLQPVLEKLNLQKLEPSRVLEEFNRIELEIQTETPGLNYQKILAKVHAGLADSLPKLEEGRGGIEGGYTPSEAENTKFAQAIGHWPAFPDTVNALNDLSRYYKLVVLSNVDKESFAKTNEGPLEGFPFDAILTAEDIGSYKPDFRNFNYMLDYVKKEFGIDKEQVLPTAVSLYYDHIPANKLGFRATSWIARSNSIMGVQKVPNVMYNWKFDTLQEMADVRKNEGE